MIGIFDSGIGGLTVAKEITKILPQYDVIYLGDTARTPYGNKTPETIIKYSLENTEFLIKKGAKIIVVACNTASSFAIPHIKQKFNIPVFEVISPAVNLAIKESKKLSIGVIGTRGTINSNIYKNKINKINLKIKVYSTACPLLVSLVEEGWIKKSETKTIIKKYLHSLKIKQIDTLILGCTHYPVLKNIIQQKIGNRVRIVDSSIASALDISNYLASHPEINFSLSKNNIFQLYVSDLTNQFKFLAKKIIAREVELKVI